MSRTLIPYSMSHQLRAASPFIDIMEHDSDEISTSSSAPESTDGQEDFLGFKFETLTDVTDDIFLPRAEKLPGPGVNEDLSLESLVADQEEDVKMDMICDLSSLISAEVTVKTMDGDLVLNLLETSNPEEFRVQSVKQKKPSRKTKNLIHEIPDFDHEYWRIFVLGKAPDPGRVIPCELKSCNKKFLRVAAVKKHMHSTHGSRKFTCNACGRSFKENSKLKRHHLVHTKEKSFTCDHVGCGKSFSLKYNLHTHKLIHLGVRPFRCPFTGCDKSFTQSANLKSHIFTHARKGELGDFFIDMVKPEPKSP